MEPLYSTKARGLGLGLAIARAILEKNSGSLRVASEPGKGSTFTVFGCTPDAQQEERTHDMTSPPPSSSSMTRSTPAATCPTSSPTWATRSISPTTASRALELVRQKPYDVALLDLKMPGMDGLTLYREIAKLRAGTVAIVVTAYASKATAEEALAAGAWQVLPKPVDFPQLLALVDEALGQPLVLVVDDDHDLCANLWDLLRERGYRVAVAHDEAEAARPAARTATSGSC